MKVNGQQLTDEQYLDLNLSMECFPDRFQKLKPLEKINMYRKWEDIEKILKQKKSRKRTETSTLFWSHVLKSETVTSKYVDTPCWNWIGGDNGSGYGVFTSDKSVTAHRYAWKLKTGKFPFVTQCVLHRCNNSFCVRPDHLYLGSRKENSEYAKECGRIPRGENHPRSKLTDAQIKEIRKILSEPRMPRSRLKEIAKKYNVSEVTIRLIEKGKYRPSPPPTKRAFANLDDFSPVVESKHKIEKARNGPSLEMGVMKLEPKIQNTT